MFGHRLRVPLAVALLSLGLAVGTAAAQQTIMAQLEPTGGSGVSGTATITATERSATVSLAVEGLTPGNTYSALFQSGTCALPGASAGQLGALQPDAAGRAQLAASAVRVGGSGMVGLTLALVADGDHIIRLTVPGQGEVACGPIPAAPGVRPAAAGGPTPLLFAALLGGFGAVLLGSGLLLRRQ